MSLKDAPPPSIYLMSESREVMGKELTTRPVVMGRSCAPTTGHYLASVAGINCF